MSSGGPLQILLSGLKVTNFSMGKKETPSSQNRDPNNQLKKLKLAVLEI